jgi:large subunit ribosomal protein L9
MAKELEVIFTEDRKGKFMMGQKKRVKLGYARNYLFPQNLAVLLTPENESRIASIEKKAEEKLKERQKLAQDVQSKLDGKTVNFKQKTHDEGQLYGSVTPQDVAEACNKEFGSDIDKFDLNMITSIKEIGTYEAKVAIHPEVKIALTVVVESENEKPVEKKAAPKEEATEDAEEVAEDTTEDVVAEDNAEAEEAEA